MSIDGEMLAFLRSVADGGYVYDPHDPAAPEVAARALKAEPPLVEGWHLWDEPRNLTLTQAGYKAVGLAPPSPAPARWFHWAFGVPILLDQLAHIGF